jgi:hypothetical protein
VGIRKLCKSIPEMSKLVLVVTNSEQEVSKSVQENIRNKEVRKWGSKEISTKSEQCRRGKLVRLYRK